MRKHVIVILVFALLLPVFAGIQSAFALQQTQTPTEPLTRDGALEIALENAGVTAQDAYDTEIELDEKNGTFHYDVDFEAGGKDYDYEIDAATGQILHSEVPATAPAVTPEPTVPVETTPQSTTGPMLQEEAVAIALAHAGYTADQVRELEVEKDREKGVLLFEVDFEAGGYEYEYKIHAETGEILHTEKERD